MPWGVRIGSHQCPSPLLDPTGLCQNWGMTTISLIHVFMCFSMCSGTNETGLIVSSSSATRSGDWQMLSRHIDSISCSLERHVCGLGLDKESLYTSDFLMALRESLAEAT